MHKEITFKVLNMNFGNWVFFFFKAAIIIQMKKDLVLMSLSSLFWFSLTDFHQPRAQHQQPAVFWTEHLVTPLYHDTRG